MKRINIYDIDGKLLITRSAQGNTQIDVRQLINGTYFIRVEDVNDKALFNAKFIKE